MLRFSMATAALLAMSSLAFASPQQPVNQDKSRRALPADSFVIAQSGPKYFVILGSFKTKAQADRRNAMFGDAYVVNTNDYPNFRNGYWSVVMGPFSKAVANQHRLANLEAVRDAYVKAGW